MFHLNSCCCSHSLLSRLSYSSRISLSQRMETENEAALSSKHGLLIGDNSLETLWTRTTTTTYLKTIAFSLLPSPIQRRLRPSKFKASRLHPTAYLDGLRGLASLSVCLLHYTSNFAPRLHAYYGVSNDKMHSSPIQLPFIRVVYMGRPFVHVFFVISGFVLSLKPLRQARAHNYADLHTTLSSSVFRRGLRLYLPCVASTFISFWFMHNDWGFPPFVKGGFWPELAHCFHELWVFASHPWDWDRRQDPPYDGHMWTIPVELSMSLLLFIVITGLSRCKTWIRLTMTMALIWYTLRCKHWAPAEFLSGALIAEFGLVQDEYKGAQAVALDAAADLEKDSNDFRINLPSSTKNAIAKAWKIFWWCQLIIALYICGWPIHNAHEVPFFRWLQQKSPDVPCPDTFWFIPVSFVIVGACHQLVVLQKILTTPFVQYWASISYALYLMHGPVMHAVDFTMEPVFRMNGGKDGAGFWGYHLQWLAGLVLTIIPIVWAADLFWRFVDQPCVDFARWLDRKCTNKQD